MGRTAIVVSVETNTEDGEDINDIKVDLGGGDVVTAPGYAPAGYDAKPLPEDYAVTTSVPGDSGQAVVGYADDPNESLAGDGEVRVYARDSSGAPVVWVWLYSDGRARIANDNGFIELAANGIVTVNNNLTVDP